MNELGEFIKISRVKMGLSQAEFAKKLNVHPTLVSKWEKGQRIPTIPELQTMYVLFQMDFSIILFPKKAEDKLNKLEDRILALERVCNIQPLFAEKSDTYNH